MKLLIAGTGIAIVVALASIATAGVVLTEETTTQLQSGERKDTRTVMVQDSKQKVQMERNTILIDLDKGTMDMISSDQKTYTEMPFPPQGPMGNMIQTMGGFNIQFKKTGNKKKIAGYDCEEYTGNGHMMMGEYTVVACFSTSAPGAADYGAFAKKVAAKVKGTGLAGLANQPDGVPLELQSTTKINAFQVPGMSPEQSAQLNKMMAARAPTVTRTTTTSIKSASLPADTFAIPAGYTKTEMQMPSMGAMGGGAAAKGETAAPPAAKP